MENSINLKWAEIHELRSLLSSTDYKVTKAFEQGYVIDEATLQAREEARKQISTLEVEIAEMEMQISNLQEGEEYTHEVLTSETIAEADKVTTNYFANGILIKTEISYKQQPISSRMNDIEQVTTEVITVLNDKGIIV